VPYLQGNAYALNLCLCLGGPVPAVVEHSIVPEPRPEPRLTLKSRDQARPLETGPKGKLI
jgi:hypothetical protein